jgi:hypothetical protein
LGGARLRNVDFASGSVLFHRSLEGDNGGYDLRLCEGWHVSLKMWGRGTVGHVERLIEDLDDLDRAFPAAPGMDTAIDLTGAEHAPLRVQLMLGKWLFKKRHRVNKMAVYGGPPLPMKIARAVCTIARMEQVGFFERHDDALHFLVKIS